MIVYRKYRQLIYEKIALVKKTLDEGYATRKFQLQLLKKLHIMYSAGVLPVGSIIG